MLDRESILWFRSDGSVVLNCRMLLKMFSPLSLAAGPILRGKGEVIVLDKRKRKSRAEGGTACFSTIDSNSHH